MFKNKNKTTTEKHSSHSQQITHSQTNRTVLRTSAHCRSLVLEHTTSNATLNPHHHSLAQARILNLAAKCKKNNKKTKRQKTSMCLKTKNRKAQQPFSEIPPPPPPPTPLRPVTMMSELLPRAAKGLLISRPPSFSASETPSGISVLERMLTKQRQSLQRYRGRLQRLEESVVLQSSSAPAAQCV